LPKSEGAFSKRRQANGAICSMPGSSVLTGRSPFSRVVCLPFDEKAGLAWARLMADGKATGRPRSGLDTITAAVAEANGCIVITDNEKDFWGVEFINPIRG
jgi:hypothetical protein